jgi:trehalose/maltose transport system substrate-binding protein
MLKRLAVLALVVVLAAALVPGISHSVAAQQAAVDCGTDQNVTINVTAGSVGNEHDTVVNLATEYMKACPNVTVNVVAHPASSTDILAQYQQFFEAQSADMDVYQIDVIWPGIFADNLVDMNQYTDKTFLDQFYPALLTNDTVNGRLVAIPWFAASGMLYYRTDLLEKYSLTVPKTWADLQTDAKTIQDGERAAGNQDFWGFVWQGDAYEGLTCDALEWQASYGGGTILTTDGTIQVNNQDTIDAFTMAAGWVGTISPDAVLTFEEEDSRAVFQAGNAAFMRNWGYAYPLGEAADSPIKGLFDVGPLPGKEAGMSAATLGGWQLAVSKYSNNIPAAVAFVKWMTSYDQLVTFHLARGEQPVMPALYKDEQLVQALPYLASLGDVLNFATPRPSTVAGGKYGDVSQAYFTAVHDVLAGSKDAATAMSDLELSLADLGFTLPSGGS